MNELGISVASLLPWFKSAQSTPYVLIRVTEASVALWPSALRDAFRRCYVSDTLLSEQQTRTGRSKTELLAAKLPDRGSTMAGDFGEILVFLYQATAEHPHSAVGPKKWRLKQDRTKPAPYSDVVQLVVPSWPTASSQDRVVCAEVKTKSTEGDSEPIKSAIDDCKKDRTSRLAKTLVWLKERALGEDLGSITLAHLERFIKATDHPPAQKRFAAVAVICAEFVDEELDEAPTEADPEYTLVVIAVPKLKDAYQAVFDAVASSVEQEAVEEL